jgi:dihydrofolate reductase
MTRTLYYTAATLDGYLADEGDSLDWLFAQDIDHEGPMGYEAFIGDVGAVVMGRTTYDWVRRHLEATGEDWAHVVPSFVFTHAVLPAVEEADIRFVSGSVSAAYPAIVDAAAGKDVWVVGGGDLAAQFADAGLLDEILVAIAPVTLGAGRPLFPRRFDLELKTLERNRAFACATYSVVGPRSD